MPDPMMTARPKRTKILVLKHNDKVTRAFLTDRDAGLLFLVIQRSDKHDDEFQDELSALDLGIADDEFLQRVRMSVLALPETSDAGIASFQGTFAIQIGA